MVQGAFPGKLGQQHPVKQKKRNLPVVNGWWFICSLEHLEEEHVCRINLKECLAGRRELCVKRTDQVLQFIRLPNLSPVEKFTFLLEGSQHRGRLAQDYFEGFNICVGRKDQS